ncbi:unnamed protein product [Urochloa humidicola]
MKKVTVPVPQGIYVPMCFCGDNCKLVQCRVLGFAYGMRFFMCNNYAHDPIKPFGNVQPKTPLALCNFMQWLDTEQAEADKVNVEEEACSASERRQRMIHKEQQQDKRKAEQEAIRKRMEDIDREEAEKREADRERKRKRARHAKAAGLDAIRKGKYPHCT